MGRDTKKEKQFSDRSRVFGVFQDNESILRRFLRRFTSSQHEVEDICQETVLRALEAEKNRQIQEPRAFLFGVAKNIIRKGLERKARSLVDFVEDIAPYDYADDGLTLEDHMDARQRMLLFGRAVATLPGQCQKVFLMKKVYGYSHKEIAKQLDISVSTVEKHVSAGLKRCSDFMARHLEREVDHINQGATGEARRDREQSGRTEQ